MKWKVKALAISGDIALGKTSTFSPLSLVSSGRGGVTGYDSTGTTPEKNFGKGRKLGQGGDTW